MAKYSVGVARALDGTTPTDWITLQTAASGTGSVLSVAELTMGGEAGSSTVARVGLERPTVNAATSPTTITPQPIHSQSGAATFTANHSWTTPATLGNDPLLLFSFNAFGGVFSWVAPPGYELIIGDGSNASQLSVREVSTNGATVAGSILVEEL